jgi:hypothetical protein
MMKKTENRPIDRQTKIMLLEAMKRGYFTPSDVALLSERVGIETICVEVIDRREQIDTEKV